MKRYAISLVLHIKWYHVKKVTMIATAFVEKDKQTAKDTMYSYIDATRLVGFPLFYEYEGEWIDYDL